MVTAETNVLESEGSGYIARAPTEDARRKEPGTTIVLHLKNKYFLVEKVLRELVMKYSDFIHFLTRMMGPKEIEEVDDEEGLVKTKEPAKEFHWEGTDKTEDERVEEILPTIELEKTPVKWDVTECVAVNSNKPLWMRSDVTDKQNDEFYTAFAKDDTAPLAHIHFVAEGDSVFRALLFIPAEAPNPFQPKDIERNKQLLRLYVRRVFVSGDFYDTIPDWPNFLRGVIDSDDLPPRSVVSRFKRTVTLAGSSARSSRRSCRRSRTCRTRTWSSTSAS